MNYISRKDILKLQHELNEFEFFVMERNPDKIPYFVRYIDRMRYNIETYITLGCLDAENIYRTLRRDWKEAKDVFFEIPDYAFDDMDEEEEKENIFRFFDYVRRIDSYIKN